VVNYNPSINEIEINYEIKMNSVINIKLLDESGRIMKESTTIANNGANIQKMDTSLENDGEYKLEVRIDNELVETKVIKK
jgi:(p)ppGpp synthase/HD superfamily hydrolase